MTIDEGTYDERGGDYAHRSGDRALERCDYEEAIYQYQSALAALSSAAPGDDETRCELLIALAWAQNRAGSIAAAQQTAIEAAANARRRFARDQLGRAALAFSPLLPWGEAEGVDAGEVKLLEEALALWPDDADSPLHVKLLARLAAVLHLSADAAARRGELSELAVVMARRLEDRASLAHALLARHLAISNPGSVEERVRIATEVVQIGEALRDSRIAFEGRFWRFCDQLELGNADALDADFDACSRLADQRDPHQSWHLLSMRATRALVAGRADEAEELVAELDELGKRWAPRFVRPAGMNRLLARIDVLKARTGGAAEHPLEGGPEALGEAARSAVEMTQSDGHAMAQVGAGGATPARSGGSGNVFRQEGEYWTIVYADTPVRLRDSKGLHYIAHLLANPAREVHVADLVAIVSGPDDDGSGTETGIGVKLEGDSGALLDRRATAEYRSRLADLREELDEATTIADTGRAQRAQHEIEMITRELSAAYGLGGRQRKAGDAGERMRKAVTNRIRRALERIRAEHPALGRHLGNAIRTGFLCAYVPEQPVEWEL